MIWSIGHRESTSFRARATKARERLRFFARTQPVRYFILNIFFVSLLLALVSIFLTELFHVKVVVFVVFFHPAVTTRLPNICLFVFYLLGARSKWEKTMDWIRDKSEEGEERDVADDSSNVRTALPLRLRDSRFFPLFFLVPSLFLSLCSFAAHTYFPHFFPGTSASISIRVYIFLATYVCKTCMCIYIFCLSHVFMWAYRYTRLL